MDQKSQMLVFSEEFLSQFTGKKNIVQNIYIKNTTIVTDMFSSTNRKFPGAGLNLITPLMLMLANIYLDL